MAQGFGGFLLLLGGGWGCGEVAGCRAGAGSGFRFFLILSVNPNENQNIKPNKKPKGP